MNDPEQRYQTLIQKILQRGFRLTSHRLAIARLLSVSEDHPNATAIYEKLKKQFPTISLATIYKTLVLFKEEGEVLEIKLQDDSHFDGNNPFPHPHLICTRCNRIFDGDEVDGIGELEKEIAVKYGFQVQRHQIVYYGICSDCQHQ